MKPVYTRAAAARIVVRAVASPVAALLLACTTCLSTAAFAQAVPDTPPVTSPAAPAAPAPGTATPAPATPPATPPPAKGAQPAYMGEQPLNAGAIAPLNAPASADPAQATGAVGDDYLVNPGDVLDVLVEGLDTTARKVRVDASGVITLPLVGTVPVAGRAPRQIETVIADMLKVKYMQDPQVTVFVEESVSQRFSIQGAVQTPNLFPLKGRMTLLQALAMSGGATKVADLSNVRILRGTGPAKLNLTFDAEKIRDGIATDPPIFGNDVIIVEASAAKTAFYETLDTIRGLLSFGTVH